MDSMVPGPNHMLPALDLSNTPDLDLILTFKKREAKFKLAVSKLHREWCLCGSAANHYLPKNCPLKNSTCGNEDEPSDADIVACAVEGDTIPDIDFGGEDGGDGPTSTG
nr:ORF2 [Torque teno felis virus]